MKIYEEINIKDTSHHDWLHLRKKGIGGSDAGAILGVNKWKTPLEVFMDKTEPVIIEKEDKEKNEAAYWGNILEDTVAKEFELRTGKKVRRKNKIMVSKEYPFMLANIDREIVGEDSILECKTANQFLAKEWDGEEIPASYIIQGQHYLAITGKKKVYYAVLIGGQKFKWKELERDEELIKIIIDKEKDFWNNFVLKNIPPALDGSSAAEKYLKERYPEATEGTQIELSNDYNSLLKELEGYKTKIKEMQEKADLIENQIKGEMKENEKAYTSDFYISWKNITSKRLDTKALKKDMPDIAEKYMKESISRRFDYKELAQD